MATAKAKPAKEAAKPAPKKIKARKKDKKNVAFGHAYIKSTFNNTIVSITDPSGAVISWSSSGQVGFKGSRKSTPFAAQMAADRMYDMSAPRTTTMPRRPYHPGHPHTPDFQMVTYVTQPKFANTPRIYH